MNSKWDIYDELIEGVPSNHTVRDCVIGGVWTYILSEEFCGVALTVKQKAGTVLHDGPITGMNLKDAAALIRSWKFTEASVGMAALNSWYNRTEHIRAMGILPDEGDNRKNDVFTLFGPQIRGSNVTVVGHFPHIEKTIAPICNLTILERAPSEGDLPDSACEYIMQEQDYVIITGMTFTNKTLPRLLELTREDAVVAIAGPSTPMYEGLSKYGIDHLSGYCVSNAEKVMEAVKLGQRKDIFDFGYMLDYAFGK